LNASLLAAQLLNGLAYGMLLFMIAAGLSIIYGFMNIVNLAHGTFFMLAAYAAYSLAGMKVNFWLAIPVAIVLIMIFSIAVEKLLLSFVYGKEHEQVLLTFGLLIIFADMVKWIWGASPRSLPIPPSLDFSITMGILDFPVYRLFVIAVGILVAVALWYFENRTRIGAIIRAGVDDRQMVSALGIHVGIVFTGVFAFGAGLAALSGILGGAILGVYPGMDTETLILSLVVIVIGGLGTWKGAFSGALLVGLLETMGQIWFPSLSMVLIFLCMTVILLVKPTGLFGKKVST